MKWEDFEEKVVHRLYGSWHTCLVCSELYQDCRGPFGTTEGSGTSHLINYHNFGLTKKLRMAFAELMIEANLSPVDVNQAIETTKNKRGGRTTGLTTPGHDPLTSWNPVCGHYGFLSHTGCLCVREFLEAVKPVFMEKQSPLALLKRKRELLVGPSGFRPVWSKLRDIGILNYDVMMILLELDADNPTSVDVRLIVAFQECFTQKEEPNPVPISLMCCIGLERAEEDGYPQDAQLLSLYDVPSVFGMEEVLVSYDEEGYSLLANLEFGTEIDWLGEKMIVVEAKADTISLLSAELVYNDLEERNPFSLELEVRRLMKGEEAE